MRLLTIEFIRTFYDDPKWTWNAWILSVHLGHKYPQFIVSRLCVCWIFWVLEYLIPVVVWSVDLSSVLDIVRLGCVATAFTLSQEPIEFEHDTFLIHPCMSWAIISQLTIPTGRVFHICYWYMYQRAWWARSRSWAQYGVLGFWFLAISGAGKISLTTVWQRGYRCANCAGVHKSSSWLLWIRSVTKLLHHRYNEWLFLLLTSLNSPCLIFALDDLRLIRQVVIKPFQILLPINIYIHQYLNSPSNQGEN